MTTQGTAGKQINLQDTFLNRVRKENVPILVYLVNGFQIRGTVAGFDNFTVIIDADNKQQMIYKHAISTITTVENVKIMVPDKDKEKKE
jgi:host factor-I protein